MAFADAYGLHVLPLRLWQRACFVLDRDNIIRHAAYVYRMGDEINFTAALDTARALM